MDLNWIEDFHALVKENGFARAATKRNISQSAFSKRIRSLENSLGTDLVKRGFHTIYLTEAGEQFLKDSQPILVALKRARQNIKKHIALLELDLNFSGATTIAQNFFPRWIETQMRNFPNVIPTMRTGMTFPEEIESLSNGETDFYLTYYSPDLPKQIDERLFQHKTLMTDLLVPVSAPISGTNIAKFSITPNAAPAPHIKRSAGSYLGAIVDQITDDQNLNIHTAYLGTNGENIIGLVLEGAGIGWLPKQRVQELLTNGSLVLAGTSQQQASIEIRIYRRKGRPGDIEELFWQRITSE